MTSGLLPWFKSCDRKPQVVGSDHCPVVAEMFAELALETDVAVLGQGRETVDATTGLERNIYSGMSGVKLDNKRRLQDILDSYEGSSDHVLAAKYFDEFSGKQQKLSMFFKKPAAGTKASSSPSPQLAEKRPAPPISPTPKKKLFFSSERDTVRDHPTRAPDADATVTVSQPTSIPNNIQHGQQKKGGTTARPTAGKANKKSNDGQQSMLSFFSSSSSKSAKLRTGDDSLQQATTSTTGNSSRTPVSTPSQSSQPLSQPEGETKAGSQQSTTSSSTSTFRPSDFADWIPGSNYILPFQSNAEETTNSWQNLFQPRQIPKCRFHNVACTEYTVNKKGPNKGRRFFLCSLYVSFPKIGTIDCLLCRDANQTCCFLYRPVGAEGDAIGQKPEFRCDYFEWRNPDRKK